MEDFRLLFCGMVEKYRLSPETAAALWKKILEILSQSKEDTE